MKPRLVVERARAKINLALHILGRRLDGYHELDSIVAFADVADVLTISQSSKTSLELTGPFACELPSNADNLVLRAQVLLSAFAGHTLAPVKIKLEKNLPMASGVGGGSADAAATLRGLAKLFDLAINPADLNGIALQLGADVPVCLVQKCCRMGGVGEVIEPIFLAMPQAAVLVNPCIPAPTAKIFETLCLERGQAFCAKIENLDDVNSWRNDLTAAAISLIPAIAAVLEILGAHPAIKTARMSGSGATCFGLTETLEQAQAVAKAISKQRPDWWVVAASLS